jgi:RHS repeat-associated protein
VASGSTPTSLTYDLNGNVLTDENGNGYTWDGLNRLTKITYSGGATSNFAYDGLSRRVSIIEKNSGGTVTSTKLYLWVGSEIAEERSSGTTVTKRFFPQGEQQSGTDYYYTRDHLGSVRELCSSTGAIVARYSYDPYGRTTLVSGTNLATKQYASYYAHQPSGLEFSVYRAFDPNAGRWLNRDPIGERGGVNLYGYVVESPINLKDYLGLSPDQIVTDMGNGVVCIMERYKHELVRSFVNRTVETSETTISPEYHRSSLGLVVDSFDETITEGVRYDYFDVYLNGWARFCHDKCTGKQIGGVQFYELLETELNHSTRGIETFHHTYPTSFPYATPDSFFAPDGSSAPELPSLHDIFPGGLPRP